MPEHIKNLIDKVMTLSTEHLSMETYKRLDSMFFAENTGLTILETTEPDGDRNGYLIAVNRRPNAELAVPADLQAALDFAEQHACTMVRFSYEADPIPELEIRLKP